MSQPLLELKRLAVSIATDDGTVRAVDGIDLALARGRTLGLVGESGCGKSVTSLAVMGLLPPENSLVSGEVRFEGRDLLKIGKAELRDLRGARLAMIFQEPMTSLNPSYTVGNQIIEAIQRHQGLDAAAARAKAELSAAADTLATRSRRSLLFAQAAAAETLAGLVSEERLVAGSLYPVVTDLRVATRAIAVAVVREAQGRHWRHARLPARGGGQQGVDPGGGVAADAPAAPHGADRAARREGERRERGVARDARERGVAREHRGAFGEERRDVDDARHGGLSGGVGRPPRQRRRARPRPARGSPTSRSSPPSRRSSPCGRRTRTPWPGNPSAPA